MYFKFYVMDTESKLKVFAELEEKKNQQQSN